MQEIIIHCIYVHPNILVVFKYIFNRANIRVNQIFVSALITNAIKVLWQQLTVSLIIINTVHI